MISIRKGIDVTDKNIWQNPKCCQSDTKDRWNKKIDKYQSRKAYYKPNHESLYGWSNCVLEYFCTTRCSYEWMNANLENIIERKHCPNKILEKIIRA